MGVTVGTSAKLLDFQTKLWTSTRKKSQPKIHFHSLRHSCASILYNKVRDLKDIQNRLGHTYTEAATDVHTHIINIKNNIAKDI